MATRSGSTISRPIGFRSRRPRTHTRCFRRKRTERSRSCLNRRARTRIRSEPRTLGSQNDDLLLGILAAKEAAFHEHLRAGAAPGTQLAAVPSGDRDLEVLTAKGASG